MMKSIDISSKDQQSYFVLGVALLVIVGLVFLSSLTGSRDSAELAREPDEPYTPEGEYDVWDSDGDGLADWEEALWRTDKDNPDSDGDGKLDGDEVASLTDPTKKGPNDEITEEIVGLRYGQSTVLGDDVNRTELLVSETLSETVVAADTYESTGTYDFSTLDVYFESILETLENKVVPEHTLDELEIIQNPTQDDHELYFFVLLGGSVNNSGEDTGLALEYVAQALSQNNSAPLENLDGEMGVYVAMRDVYLEIPVPQEYENEHIEILNTLEHIIESFNEMRQIIDDPVTGYAGLERYSQYTKELSSNMTSLGEMLSGKVQLE